MSQRTDWSPDSVKWELPSQQTSTERRVGVACPKTAYRQRSQDQCQGEAPLFVPRPLEFFLEDIRFIEFFCVLFPPCLGDPASFVMNFPLSRHYTSQNTLCTISTGKQRPVTTARVKGNMVTGNSGKTGFYIQPLSMCDTGASCGHALCAGDGCWCRRCFWFIHCLRKRASRKRESRLSPGIGKRRETELRDPRSLRASPSAVSFFAGCVFAGASPQSSLCSASGVLVVSLQLGFVSWSC